MSKVLQFKNGLDDYLNLYDLRMQERDFLGALDAGRNALLCARTRIDREAINLLLSEAYYEMGLNVLSCEHAFRAVSNIETRANAYFCIGKNLVSLKEYKLAVKYFDEVLSFNCDGELVGAVYEWCEFIRENLTQRNKFDPILLTRALVRQKRYDTALAQLEPYLQKNDIKTLVAYCDILVLAGEHNRARELLQQILSFDMYNTGAIIVLANICMLDGDYTSLEMNLCKLNELHLSVDELEVVGGIYARSGNYASAIKNYQKMLEKDEFNAKIMLFIAICYYNLGDNKEALYYIGRARWIDIENPTFNIFYEIFSLKQEKNLQVSTTVPLKTGQEKLNFVLEAIDLQNFDGIFETSLTLANDIEWTMTLKNAEFTQKIVQKLAFSRKKSIISLYNKEMLSTRVGEKQKFYLAKYALVNAKSGAIDFTNNMRYHSFRLKIPKHIASNLNLCRGFCGAVVYAEIYNLDVNLDTINQKFKLKSLENIDFPFSENLISCLYFYENTQILEQACIYFDTQKDEVERAIKSLNWQ